MKRTVGTRHGRIVTTWIGYWLATVVLFFGFSTPLGAAPLVIVDGHGEQMAVFQQPVRVVSLVPSITEILFGIGAGDTLVGVTIHDTDLPEAAGLPIVGGFSHPSIQKIEQLSPDVIFLSKNHAMVRERFAARDVRLIELDVQTIAGSLETIRLLGRLFEKEDQARRIIANIQAELDLVAKKVNKIPPNHRRRVIRIMGGEEIMTPGQASFQNELIRAAGGIAPPFVGKEAVVPVTLTQWRRFHPQVIYGCEGDKEIARKTFIRDGWKDVEAVRDGRIFYFPCDLTCRASTHTGYFVSWLASRIYADYFSDSENRETADGIVDQRSITVDLPYVKNAWLTRSHIDDFIGKTLIIDFARPQSVLSTLEGWRSGIQTVGNHYLPPQTWGLGHQNDLSDLKNKIASAIGKSGKTSSLLFTGADMDHLSVQKRRYKDMQVYALVTAGVQSNALRMSKDTGDYYEPGTINMILLTNMQLSTRAMARAIITATEAKTAALQDLDIRSSENPMLYGATGTGTDNIIIAQGEGLPIDNAGGHTKIGELIAAVVHAGVTQAVLRQNGLMTSRSIFSRLRERGINLFSLVSNAGCECGADPNQLTGDVEAMLLDPRYAGFLAASLSISDSFEQGLITDLSAHEEWCRIITEEIAEGKIEHLHDFDGMDKIPIVLRRAAQAILTGVFQHRMRSMP